MKVGRKESSDERRSYGVYLAGSARWFIYMRGLRAPRTMSLMQVGSANTSSMYCGGFRCSIAQV